MGEPYHHGALRQALLRAAETILERDGIQALTLRAAARAASVSHAAPAHHFGDLTGLLSELATVGFTRLRERMEAEIAAALHNPRARVATLGRGYIGFARASPGLFLLMFRSERLDWSRPSLRDAGEQAFAMLTGTDANMALPAGLPRLASVTAQWSLVHGLAMLLTDGRLGAITDVMPEGDTEALIEAVLAGGRRDG